MYVEFDGIYYLRGLELRRGPIPTLLLGLGLLYGGLLSVHDGLITKRVCFSTFMWTRFVRRFGGSIYAMMSTLVFLQLVSSG